jgi:hypothetical protein
LRRVGGELHLEHPRRTGELDALAFAQCAPQHRADVSVAHRIAEGLQLMFAGLQPREAEMTRIGDVDATNGARAGRDLRPDPEGLQDAARTVAERRGAIIEARLGGTLGLDGLDQHDLQRCVLQCQRKTRADHATADDRDIAAVGSFAHAVALTRLPSALRSHQESLARRS